MVEDSNERNRVYQLYTEVLTRAMDVTSAVAREAIRLKSSRSTRIPMVDCLIAATARENGLILVHRDKHMDGLASKNLKVKRLPDK